MKRGITIVKRVVEGKKKEGEEEKKKGAKLDRRARQVVVIITVSCSGHTRNTPTRERVAFARAKCVGRLTSWPGNDQRRVNA